MDVDSFFRRAGDDFQLENDATKAARVSPLFMNRRAAPPLKSMRSPKWASGPWLVTEFQKM